MNKELCQQFARHVPFLLIIFSRFSLAGLDLSVETFPADNVTDPKAYLAAIKAFLPGDAVTIFTPDDTHFEIALAAIERGK